MRLYEFLDNKDNNNILNIIEGLIYFDGRWMFPEYNLDSILINVELVIKLGEGVVSELNSSSIDPNDYTPELVFDIIKNLRF